MTKLLCKVEPLRSYQPYNVHTRPSTLYNRCSNLWSGNALHTPKEGVITNEGGHRSCNGVCLCEHASQRSKFDCCTTVKCRLVYLGASGASYAYCSLVCSCSSQFTRPSRRLFVARIVLTAPTKWLLDRHVEGGHYFLDTYEDLRALNEFETSS